MSPRLRALLAALITFAALAAPADADHKRPRPSTATGASVTAPTVAGPVARTSPVGDPAHGYPFLTTDVELAKAGYIEQEFHISGQATRYTVTGNATATVRSTGHPYSTRIVVRRPVSAKAFNGVVIAEWYNVSNQWDQEVDWFQTHEHLLREGYVWVGVSAQPVGVHAAITGLRAWSPSRYGALNVNAGGTITDNSLSYDIFSQAVKALRSPAGTDPLGSLPQPQYVIATGHSQSASLLRQYANSILPLSNILDAVVLHGFAANAARGPHQAGVPDQLRRRRREPRCRRPPARLRDAADVGGRGRLARRLEADHGLRPAAQARHRHLPRRVPRRAADLRAAVALQGPAAHGAERALRPHRQLGRVRHQPAERAADHDDEHGARGHRT